MLYHGSHPEHPMRVFKHPRAGVMCSICKASAHPSMVEWSLCVQENCGYTLCSKCMVIDELLFDTPQVIIRNPILSHEDMSICLRTRPRRDAHILCPLYPGRLMVAVSSAKGTLDINETYYRLKNGGWVNAAHVVRVLPSQQLIEELTKAHLRGEEQRSDNLMMPLSDLLVCIDESFGLMDERSPYGPVMASLTLFPLIQYSSNLRLLSPEDRATFVRASLGFIHYLFHFVLDEIEHWMKNIDPRVKTTALTLYIELLGKSLILARDVAVSQTVELPSELGPLVTRTAKAAVSLMPIVECGTLAHGGMNVTMRTPSVATRQVELEEEQARLFMCCCNIVENSGWLLLHSPSFTYEIDDIRPLRVAVSIVPNSENLQRMFCQVVTNALERMPSLQRKIHDLDVVEVAISLAGRTTCAESQMAIFKLIAAIAHKSPRNISQMASLVISPLIQLGMKGWNTVVANAAFECFAELAYNDPRIDSNKIHLENESMVLPVCSALLHPNGAPYQIMNILSIGEEHRVAICEHCKQLHPPENSFLAFEPQFAYFHCQCTCCLHNKFPNPLPPPNIPTTLAIQTMIQEGISRLMLFWLKCGESAVANALGRLSLKITVPPEVPLALYRALLKQSLLGYADAALALAAQSHLPGVREMLRGYPGAAISQYLSTLPGLCRPLAVGDGTPGKASEADEEADGLSPSPDVAVKRSGRYPQRPTGTSPPLVDLFNGPRKMYLDDVL